MGSRTNRATEHGPRDASISFDRIADRYDETRGGMGRARNIAAGLAPRLGPGPTLEVGVGTGVISAALGELSHPTVGVDLSAPMLRLAVGRLGERVVRGDAHRLPVRSGSCANVLLVWVLHLVADPVAVLVEARRVLRHGGRIIAAQRPAQGPADDIGDIYNAMTAALTGERADVGALPANAEAAGLTLLERAMTPARDFAESPDEAIANIEQRTYSSLWDLDDETWAAVVQPAIDRLRALPAPHEQRTRSASQELFVFTAT